MTVGVGIPEAIFHERLATLTVTNKTIIPTLLDLLEQEIAVTTTAIERHKGVSIYQDNCTRWGHHLEAFERTRDTLQRLISQKAKPKRAG